MEKKNEIIEVVTMDGKAIDVNREYTPSEYFEKIKAMKDDCSKEDLEQILEYAEKQFKKFEIMDQKEAANICKKYIDMFIKEIDIVNAGFTKYVRKKDVEEYMTKISEKCVFCCEIADYPRDIPDEIVDKVAPYLKLFDHIYIIFTDYTQKVSKSIDKKTREKDPIMFGALDIIKGSTPVVGPRFYYIADWVDEYCELTLEQMLSDFSVKNRNDIVNVVKIAENSSDVSKLASEFSDEVTDDIDISKIIKRKTGK